MRRLSAIQLIQRPFAKACTIATIALATTVVGQGILPTQAQAQLSACQPPSASEYLLLAVTPDASAQARVTSILPASAQTLTCNYLGETVIRVGGFGTQESANAWAEYVAKQAKVSAFVAKPSTGGKPGVLPPFPPSTTAPATPKPQYNPKPLGNGYAVLVNYYNKPAIAKQIMASTGQPVGLVSYGQKPYLLASFTSDQSAANVLLQALTDKGLWASIVDGRRVMLLKANVGQ